MGGGALEKQGNPRIRTIVPTWKVYGNPFYHFCYYDHHIHHHHTHHQHYQHHHHRLPYQNCLQQEIKQDHVHLPHSARKLGNTLWCLINQFQPKDPWDAFCKLHLAQAQIKELKAELEFKHRLWKKAEALNKELAREVSEERKGRKAMELLALAVEVSRSRKDMERLKREVEEILRVPTKRGSRAVRSLYPKYNPIPVQVLQAMKAGSSEKSCYGYSRGR